MNKRCVALSDEQYKQSVELMRNGFVSSSGVVVKPNPRIATIVVIQAVLGLRLGDVLGLRMGSFLKDGERWRLDIMEQKTKKIRNFTVPAEVYRFVRQYASENHIEQGARLFDVSERQVERHLNRVFEKMGLPLKNYGSHSYRKYFATKVYVDNDMNIELVRVLLQHSSVATTQRYIGISRRNIEEALFKTSSHLI